VSDSASALMVARFYPRTIGADSEVVLLSLTILLCSISASSKRAPVKTFASSVDSFVELLHLPLEVKKLSDSALALM
jgi:hypothetical protein